MNWFQLCGDVIHLFAFVLLLFKLWFLKSAAGVSAKTQILLALVFSTRYLDLFVAYVSMYNAEMKLVYISLSYFTVISLYAKFRKTYESHLDTLRIEFLIAAATIGALVLNYDFTAIEVFWAFSEYLEAVAAWPQFYMIRKTGQVRTLVFVYLSALGLYRILYIANWVYRYSTQNYYDPISYVPGIVQVIPFFVFWILCLTKEVDITSEKRSWFAKNLAQSGKNGIFTIQVPEGLEPKDDKVALLDDSEGAEGREGESTVAKSFKKQDIPAVHKI